MTARFTVLASGSSGNSCLLQCNGRGLMIDCGRGPRVLAARMAACGLGWHDVSAVVLTHTHSDHWNEASFSRISRLGLAVHCHRSHAEYFSRISPQFTALQAAKHVQIYDSLQVFSPTPGLTCRPLPVSHDGGATFGFRFDGSPGLYGSSWSVGYVADLGCWDTELALALGDVDLLALEFNHDVEMQLRSARPERLIRRVLGDAGHLSNKQAAALLCAVVAASLHTCLQYVVPLHLSRECNLPSIAMDAARNTLRDAGSAAAVHLHALGRGGPSLTIGGTTNAPKRPPRRTTGASQDIGLWDDTLADAS